jgi:hypothetical protein
MIFEEDQGEELDEAGEPREPSEGEELEEGLNDGAESDSDAGADDADDGDYAAQAQRRAEMIDYLKRDIHDERKRRQEAERRLQELDAKAEEQARGSLEHDIEAARATYARLLDEGDGAEIAKASEALTALVVRRETLAASTPTRPPVHSTLGAPAPAIADAAQRWIARNPWFSKGGELAQKAVEIASALEAKGYDTEDPALYAEVDRRLKPYRQRMGGPDRPPNAAPVNRGAGVDAKPGRALTAEDKRVMREVLRWDPNKPEHRRAYLRRNDPLE